jgi:type II secretory pathway pseudopilin PulG
MSFLHPLRQRWANDRRARSLLELMVVLTVMSIVLSAISLTMWSLVRIERQMSRDVAQLTGHARLAKLWRADAHVALRANLKEDCTFALANGRSVRYWIDGERLRREARQAATVEHRETFELPTGARASFTLSKSAERELAVLSITGTGELRTLAPPVRPLTLAAVVNLQQATSPPDEPEVQP